MDHVTPYSSVEHYSRDSRLSERVDHRISVAYSFEPTALPTQKPTPFRFGMLVNISTQGLCLRAREEFVPDQLLALYLKISDQSNGIKALGKVIWMEEEGDGYERVGIRLIGSLPSDWRRFLET